MRKRRPKLRFVNPYKTENELCEVLIDYARKNGWAVHCETSNYDLLLVKNIQIGVQAKLKANVEVLAQSLISPWNKFSPHILAVLVPYASDDFKKVAHALSIFVIEGVGKKWDVFTEKQSWGKEIATSLDGYNKNYLCRPIEECWVPEVEINVPAGVPSPKSITEWKIKAVKLCLLLNRNGYLTSTDFKNAKINMGLWLKKKWLLSSKEKEGKLIKYIRNANAILPDGTYCEIVEALNKKH